MVYFVVCVLGRVRYCPCVCPACACMPSVDAIQVLYGRRIRKSNSSNSPSPGEADGAGAERRGRSARDNGVDVRGERATGSARKGMEGDMPEGGTGNERRDEDGKGGEGKGGTGGRFRVGKRRGGRSFSLDVGGGRGEGSGRGRPGKGLLQSAGRVERGEGRLAGLLFDCLDEIMSLSQVAHAPNPSPLPQT